MSHSEVIHGYGLWVEDKLAEGWKGYILTVMFNQLSGSSATILKTMTDQLERLYSTMLTRIVRNPRAPCEQGNLPIWLAAPDLPVPKHQRVAVSSVTVNDGLHMHAICLIPPRNRLGCDLCAHIEAYQPLYVRDGRLVQRLHSVPITKNPGYVAGYALKSLTRRRFGSDDLLILPRSRSELP